MANQRSTVTKSLLFAADLKEMSLHTKCSYSYSFAMHCSKKQTKNKLLFGKLRLINFGLQITLSSRNIGTVGPIPLFLQETEKNWI